MRNVTVALAALVFATACKTDADQPAPATKPADPVAPQPAPTPAPAPAPAPSPAPVAQCCCVTQPVEEEEYAVVATTQCTSTEGTCTDMAECTKLVAAIKPPGACVAIPEPAGNLPAKNDHDLDGDGTMDTVVQVSEGGECTADDCDHAVYLKRGACGHLVGTVSIGWSDEASLVPVRGKGGLFALSVKEAEGGTSDYVFNGTKYVKGKLDLSGP
jgi:hypothetical protein